MYTVPTILGASVQKLRFLGYDEHENRDEYDRGRVQYKTEIYVMMNEIKSFFSAIAAHLKK